MCVFCINEQANVPIQQQQLLYNGNEMSNSDKLSALGVKDDDLLMMMVSNASSGYGRLKLATLLLNISMWLLLVFVCLDDSVVRQGVIWV